MSSDDLWMSQLLNNSDRKISREEYESFRREYVMYALADKRYGQAFIEKFDLSRPSLLYHIKDRKIAERWIQDNYLEQ